MRDKIKLSQFISAMRTVQKCDGTVVHLCVPVKSDTMGIDDCGCIYLTSEYGLDGWRWECQNTIVADVIPSEPPPIKTWQKILSALGLIAVTNDGTHKTVKEAREEVERLLRIRLTEYAVTGK